MSLPKFTTTSLHLSANVLKYCAVLLYCHQHVRHPKQGFKTFISTLQNFYAHYSDGYMMPATLAGGL